MGEQMMSMPRNYNALLLTTFIIAVIGMQGCYYHLVPTRDCMTPYNSVAGDEVDGLQMFVRANMWLSHPYEPELKTTPLHATIFNDTEDVELSVSADSFWLKDDLGRQLERLTPKEAGEIIFGEQSAPDQEEITLIAKSVYVADKRIVIPRKR